MAEELTPRDAMKQSEHNVNEYNKLVERDPYGNLDFEIEHTREAIPKSGDPEYVQSHLDSLLRRKAAIVDGQAENIANARTAVEQNSGAYHDAARIDAMLDGVEIKSEDGELTQS